MPFFFITFAISLFSIALSQILSVGSKIGFGDVFQYFYKTAGDRLVSQGLSIFAFAFFLHAILQSKTFQSLFASKRKWLEKKKYFAIGLITILVAFLSSNLSWFDEFVHFYPLVVPLMMAMGFDAISSIVCLYGGSIAGLMGLVSSERMSGYFGQCFGDDVKQGISYNGMTGIVFRFLGLLLFTSIVILFNIWYCNRNRKKIENEPNKLAEEEKQPPFNTTRKVILAVAVFFLSFSVAAQFPQLGGFNKTFKKTPEWISSQYKEETNEEVGRIEKERITRIEEQDDKSYWDKFGRWEERTIDCWLIIGAIIICLIAKQSIMGTLTTAIQSSIPILLVYIFAAVPASILKDSGVSDQLAKAILPDKVLTSAKYLALIPIFVVSFLLTFFISSPSIVAAFIAALAPTLASISSSVLIHAAIFSWTGGILGMAFSPNSGILIASLKKVKVSYKEYIKKTWVLWSILSVSAFGLISFWTWFNVK